ncbi:23S rRNA (guanine(745)-N(1))-methyltransferase [Pseudoalteromonas sp. MMG005]|uniref:23S rRNA (guanine(745)-N(1))-methyltransferase n=1 Tax=Pseudoalteromonas sp. MMG005 TaxID=2822682 RepID=UPI001B3A603D|nr:23S rRNA (guanine(745)-N(1))-methyltransferase [Pseudoalteromonas sp. MMG005]MBQ4845023.1 23S rRNA (guanine(745)-N(1))-methyltransferase [Pseudoalteromonas sp. MMG005]
MTLMYHCPLCSKPLKTNDQSLQCDSLHQFDFAKEGYVNLLPVQNKKSKQPGDNLEMVQARRAFFATDHYDFLRQEIAQRVIAANPNTVIDLGCGEGFYTQAFTQHLSATAQVYGVDISKSAIKYAAKRYKNVNFSVASIKQAPFKAQSADVLVSIFAPVFSDELHRLCDSNGKVIIVSPGPKHLFELKNCIYEEVNLHEAIECPAGFEYRSQTLLEVQQDIPTKTIAHLIMMTPFAWKFKPSHYEALHKKSSHRVTLSFYISEFSPAVV